MYKYIITYNRCLTFYATSQHPHKSLSAQPLILQPPRTPHASNPHLFRVRYLERRHVVVMKDIKSSRAQEHSWRSWQLNLSSRVGSDAFSDGKLHMECFLCIIYWLSNIYVFYNRHRNKSTYSCHTLGCIWKYGVSDIFLVTIGFYL
jgi:hypothetical protein